MSLNKKVYSLNEGYSPYVFQSETGLKYCFPVSSGIVDLSFEFDISDQDLDLLKSSDLKYKALYFILFHEAQSTFGSGHPSPRQYTFEEFRATKDQVLNKPDKELEKFVKEYSKRRRNNKEYFYRFSKSVFGF